MTDLHQRGFGHGLMSRDSKGMTTKKLPNPGSDEAVKQGCICPVLDNCHGKGAFDYPDGNFYVNEGCPLHWEGRKEKEE